MKRELRKGINNLLRIDTIRLSKLLEMFQYTAMAFGLGFVSGSLINHSLPKVEETIATSELILGIIAQLFLISTSLYYSQKILKLSQTAIPFWFSLSKKYIPCHHNECIIGITLGFSLSFIGSLARFHDRVKLLHDRLTHH